MDRPDELAELLLRAARACSTTNERLEQFCITELEYALRMLAVAEDSPDRGIRQRTIQTARIAYFKAMSTIPRVNAAPSERAAIDGRCRQFQRQLLELVEDQEEAGLDGGRYGSSRART